MKIETESKGFLLSKENFSKVFDALNEEYELFGPTVKNGQGIYSDTDICVYERLDSFGQLSVKERTHFSAKEIAFAISEKLFDITPGGLKEPMASYRKRIIFARACDIEGFLRLDKIYLNNGPVDFYYKRIRDTIYFFMIECPEGFNGCFCQSVGADEAEGYLISLRQMGENFLVSIKDENFDKWFDIEASQIDGQDRMKEYKKIQQTQVSIPALSKKGLFNNPLWDEYSKRCIGCGRCNVVCPTCSCFSIYDTSDDKGGSIRKRVWAGCQIDGFAKVAGGHEYRTDKGQRMRYKLLHKFHDFKNRFGQYMCVGCGRCIEACPEYIDIRISLERLNHG